MRELPVSSQFNAPTCVVWSWQLKEWLCTRLGLIKGHLAWHNLISTNEPIKLAKQLLQCYFLCAYVLKILARLWVLFLPADKIAPFSVTHCKQNSHPIAFEWPLTHFTGVALRVWLYKIRRKSLSYFIRVVQGLTRINRKTQTYCGLRPGSLVGKTQNLGEWSREPFPRSVRLFLCVLACEQAFYLGESRLRSRESSTLKGDAGARGATRLARHNSPRLIY